MKKNIGKKFTKCVISSLLISAMLASVPAFAVREGEGTGSGNGEQTTNQQQRATTTRQQPPPATHPAAPPLPTFRTWGAALFNQPTTPSFIRIDPEASYKPQFTALEHPVEVDNDYFTFQSAQTSIPQKFANSLNELTPQQHDVNVSDKIYLRRKLVFVGKGDLVSRPKLNFSELEIGSGATVYLENVDLSGEIELPAYANLVLVNCTVNGRRNLPQTRRNTAVATGIEVANRSKIRCCNVNFINPDPGLKTYVGIETHATGKFDHCDFVDSPQDGITAMVDSSVAVTNSNFTGNQKFGIYLYQGTRGTVQNCNFDHNDRDFLLLKGSQLIADQIRSTASTHVATVADKSKLKLTHSMIQGGPDTTIAVFKNSEINCLDDRFEGCACNIFHFRNSTGLLKNISATGRAISLPLIFIAGNHSNVVVADSQVENEAGPVICVRDFARPHFHNDVLEGNSDNYGLRISDFAWPSFDCCRFRFNAPVGIRVERAARSLVRNSYFETRPNQVVFHLESQGKLVAPPNSNQFSTPVNFDYSKNVTPPTPEEEQFAFRYTENPDGEDQLTTDSIVIPIKHHILPDDQLNATIQEMRGDFPTRDHQGEFVVNSCGHLISADQAHEIKTKLDSQEQVACPVCNSLIQGIHEIYDEPCCPICRDEEQPNSVLINCGHTVCPSCATTWANGSSGNGQCPICRGNLTSCAVMDFDQSHNCDIKADDPATKPQEQTYEPEEHDQTTEPEATDQPATKDSETPTIKPTDLAEAESTTDSDQ